MSREMKDSGIEWIGEIPEGWNIAKAKYFIVINNGSNPHLDGNIPVYGSGTQVFKTCGEYKNGPAVLIGRKGSIEHPKYIHGKFWNVDTAFDVESKSENMLLKFYYYLATVFDYKQYISQTTIPSMTQTDYQNMIIPILPLSEQRQIVHFLDRKCAAIDTVVERTRDSIEKLEEYKKALITRTVTKGLDPNAKMKDSGVEWIGEIPEEWHVQPLRMVYSRRINRNKHLQENNLLSLSYGNIIRKNIETREGLLPESFDGYNIVEPGDIVIRGTDLQNDHKSLRTGLVNERGIITSAYIALCPKTDVNSEYYHYLLYCYDIEKVFYNMGGGLRQSLDYWDLSGMLVLVPPRQEQRQIADFLDRKCAVVDALISRKKEAISKLEEYKKSLIYYAVTGKIDCRGEAI